MTDREQGKILVLMIASFFIGLLVCSLASSQTILARNEKGEFFLSVFKEDGTPGEWQNLHVDHFIGINGTPDDPPDLPEDPPPEPPDEIAVGVDKWTDQANDPKTRAKFAAVWKSVLSELRSGAIMIRSAEVHIRDGQTPILDALPEGLQSRWLVWGDRINGLVDRQKSRGLWTIETVASIQKGIEGL